MPSSTRALLAVVCLHSLSAACSKQPDSSSPGTARSSQPLRVVVERPAAADTAQTLLLPGNLEPWQAAALYARVTGYLEVVLVDIGDEVRQGDVLARILMPEMQAELRREEARLEKERAELRLARLTRTRLQKLREKESAAIPQQDVDIAVANEAMSAAEVAVAEAEVARLKTLSGFAVLCAPFSGRIVRRVLHPGALVREGTSSGAQPVLELARTDPLRLAFEVPEDLVPRVHRGEPVKIRIDAFPGMEIDGVVARTQGALDETTRSMRAEVDLSNKDRKFQPGMYASVRLQTEPLAGAWTIPSRAVRGGGADRFVLVATDGVLRRQPVTVASDDGRIATVVAGVSSNDQIVVAGSPMAREGARVEAMEGK